MKGRAPSLLCYSMPRWQKLEQEEEDDDDGVVVGPRCSSSRSHRRHFSSPVLSDRQVRCLHAASAGCGGSRLSFSYSRLPDHQLSLSIVKLDGSYFDVQVRRTATVAELKLAVEEVFSQSPKEGEGSISWSHVWGHFCLQYDGRKLTDGHTPLQAFGIKDGDQLHFARHLSADHSPFRRLRHPKGQGCIVLRRSRSLTEQQDNARNMRLWEDKALLHLSSRSSLLMNNTYRYRSHNKFWRTKFRSADFLRGWLSSSRKWCRRRMRLEKGPHFRGSKLQRCNK